MPGMAGPLTNNFTSNAVLFSFTTWGKFDDCRNPCGNIVMFPLWAKCSDATTRAISPLPTILILLIEVIRVRLGGIGASIAILVTARLRGFAKHACSK